MLKKDYFEAVNFTNGSVFNVSNKINLDYINKMHWHPFVEILVSLSGANEVTINFTNYSLGYNDLVIIYPGDLHAVRDCSENSLLIIQFPYELMTIMSELKNNDVLFIQSPCIKYDPFNAQSDRLILLIKEFAEAYETDNPFREVHMYSLLLGFFEKAGLYCLNSQQESAQELSNLEYKATKQMAAACLFISHNCTSPLTLEDVANHMGMSKSHFAHLFKGFTNMTFVDFLISERIKRAKSMFTSSNARIIDIAFDAGFSSISSFNRAFKKITGMSPSQFRETITDSMV